MPWPISLYQGLRDIYGGFLPKLKLSNVRAGTIATGNERRCLRLDCLKRRYNILALDPCGIVLRPDDYEVVVHDRIALHAKSFGEELLLS